jgi:hypothetical protein
MDNAAWFTRQLRLLRDDVIWTAEIALREISSREEELFLQWSDQAARDYRARYGALRREVEDETLDALHELVSTLEGLERSIVGISHEMRWVDGRLTEARQLNRLVDTHIENVHRHIGDSETHTAQVEQKIEQAQEAMQRALELLSSADSVDSGAGVGTEAVPEPTPERDTSPVPLPYDLDLVPSEDVEPEGMCIGSGAVGEPQWSTLGTGVGEESGGRSWNESPIPAPSTPAPALTPSYRYSPTLQSGLTCSDCGGGSSTPSWALRQGDDILLAFSTGSPAGALPFLGTSPAPASSYLSLQLGSDSKWRTPLGFGTVPKSYDLKIGTSSFSSGSGGFAYAPSIGVQPLEAGLSSGGGPSMAPSQISDGIGVAAAPGAWAGAFGNTCSLAS